MFTVDTDAFRSAGFLELGPRLSDDDRSRVLEHFDALDGRDRISPGYQAQYDGEGEARRLRKLRRLLWNDRRLFGPIVNRIGAPELAEELIGPTAVAILHAAFLKPAHVGTHVAPHQDQALWNEEYPGAFSMWTALTEVSPDNGGLYGYPGSHADGVIEHAEDPDHPWHETLTHVEDQLGERHDFILKPGESAVWDRMFVHGSGPNQSADDRRGMVIVFADGAAEDFNPRDVMTLAEIRSLAQD